MVIKCRIIVRIRHGTPNATRLILSCWVSYIQQLPLLPHSSCHDKQAWSNRAPNINGPGTAPIICQEKDCRPNARDLWSSATTLSEGRGREGGRERERERERVEYIHEHVG